MNIIHINEENHGHIGTAVSMKAAFQHLFKRGWIDAGTEFYIGEDWTTLELIIKAEYGEYTEENAFEWCMQNADNYELWDGLFYFHHGELIEED